MNINDMISPQTRAKVYQVLMIVGLTLGALGTGIGAVAASGFTLPAAVTAVFLTLNAVYAYVAGAFNFVAKANVPTQETTPAVHLVETDAAKVAELFARVEEGRITGLPDRPVNRENVEAHKEAMLGELTEQNIRDIQDTIASVPTQDQYQPGGVALTVEDEDEDA